MGFWPPPFWGLFCSLYYITLLQASNHAVDMITVQLVESVPYRCWRLVVHLYEMLKGVTKHRHLTLWERAQVLSADTAPCCAIPTPYQHNRDACKNLPTHPNSLADTMTQTGERINSRTLTHKHLHKDINTDTCGRSPPVYMSLSLLL